MQISYSVYPKISEENNLQSVAQGYYANTEGLMQMERDRDNRREHDARPCAYAGTDSTSNIVFQIMGHIKEKVQ